MRWSTQLLIGLFACDPAGDDRPHTPAPEPVPTPAPQPTPVPKPVPTTPQWIAPIPVLDVAEMVAGERGAVVLTGAPPGAIGSVWRSTAGEDGVSCDADARCLQLEGGTEWIADLVVDPTGTAGTQPEIPAGEPAGPAYYQALVVAPDGSWTPTNTLLRHVQVPGALARAGFADVTGPSGLDQTFTTGNSHTGGNAWVDVNGDWWPDLFIANGSGVAHALYLNEGDGTFAQISAGIAKPDLAIEDAGVVFGDLDNDGDSDLVIPVDNPFPMSFDVPQPFEGGPNLVYLNNGDGTFVEDGQRLGVHDPRGWRTIAAALADVDRDGWLDLWLGNWAMAQVPPGDNQDRLLMNQGDGTFADAAPMVDLAGRDALVGLFFDLGSDLTPDLYIGNVAHRFELPDYDPQNELLRNVAGSLLDATGETPGWGDDAWAAMGADVGDIDNDGDWDLYVTNLWLDTPKPRGNVLYRGAGAGLTDNVCDAADLCAGYASWPTAFQDFDRDGWVDLWVGTSFIPDPDLLFLNDGDGTFTPHQVGAFVGNQGRGGSVADYDGDGAMDIFLWRWNQDSRLFRNSARDANHWLELKLLGAVSNRDAIGAEVTAVAGGVAMRRRVTGGDSAHSQGDLAVHFGLGAATEAAVSVRWPSGITQDLGTLAADRFHAADELGGPIPEVLAGSASWDAVTGALQIRATSTLRGRSHLNSVPWGAVPWVVSEGAYVLDTTSAADPGLITVTGAAGGNVAFTAP